MLAALRADCGPVDWCRAFAHLYNMDKVGEQRMLAIRAVKAVVSVRSACYYFQRGQLSKLILYSGQPKAAHARQLSHITFLLRWTKEQAQ